MTTPWILRSSKRFFIIFVLTLVVPMVVFISLLLFQMQASFKKQAVEKNREAVALSAQVIHEHFLGITQYSQLFVRRQLMLSAIENKGATVVRRHLEEFITQNSNVERVFIVDPDGVELYDYPHDPKVIGKSFAFRDWYKGVAQSQKTYISEVYKRAAAPEYYVIAVATPIRTPEGVLLGYLVTQTPIEFLSRNLTEARSGFSGSIYVIDHHGFLATRVRAGESPMRLDRQAAVRRMFVGKSGTIQDKDPVSQTESLMSYQVIPDTGWLVLAQQSTEEVFKPVKKLYQLIIGFSLMALVLMILLGFLWVRVIFEYHRMRRTTESIIVRKTAELARTEAQLEQMKLFSFAATHDLQEPLHKILSFLGLLKTHNLGELSGQGPYYLDCVERASRNMQMFMEKLREMARIPLEEALSERVDLRQVVGEILSETEFTQLRPVDSILVGNLPVIEGNHLQMHLLFHNLIENAFKYHLPEPPLFLSIDSEAAGDGSVKIIVRDKGIGFESKYAEQIFQPFKRLHTRDKYHGSGMGLAICQGIVKHHGGSIRASSRPLEGTTFEIVLPVSRQKGPKP
ncbi:MAG: ATP-binding protein [Candidatus Omnitrophota bacterium]